MRWKRKAEPNVGLCTGQLLLVLTRNRDSVKMCTANSAPLPVVHMTIEH